MNTQDTNARENANAPDANAPDDAQLSDEELGKVNAGLAGTGLGPLGALIYSLFSRPKPRVTVVTPLHPDDPGDGSAWKNIQGSAGHYDG